jgi:glycosyltransferase involved in cell wall biosynthesis
VTVLSKLPAVLISAPSLQARTNVSGVSRVCIETMTALADSVDFIHLMVGANDHSRTSGPINALKAAIGVVRSGAQVFHSNTSLTPKSVVRDLGLCLLARLSGKRILLHVHGGEFMAGSTPGVFFGTLIHLLLGLAEQVVVLSRTEVSNLSARFPAAAAKTTYIYNFSNLADRPTRQRGPVVAGKPLQVAFVGRLSPEKGVDRYLAAAEKSYATPMAFAVHGEGGLASAVQSASERLPQLTFHGVFDGAAAEGIYSQADLLVLPSLFGEGMPMVIIEAMSAGCVPVSTPIGSTPEIIEDGRTGFLIHDALPETLDFIADAVAQDPGRLAAMGAAARAYAEQNFSPKANVRKLLAIYTELSR